MERPSSLMSQSVTFSNYKSRNTTKVLAGISPSGLVTFVSELWGGRVSDKNITVQNDLLDLLYHGDSVMADKGFEIEECLADIGVSLNIPEKIGFTETNESPGRYQNKAKSRASDSCGESHRTCTKFLHL